VSNSHRVQTVGQGLTMADQKWNVYWPFDSTSTKSYHEHWASTENRAQNKRGNKATYIILHTKTIALERWTTT